VLWQLPPMLPFDAGRLEAFFEQLPRSTTAAARVAEGHDARLRDGAWTTTQADRPLRHAVEVRHASYREAAFVELLRRHDIALVVADTAGKWPYMEDLTSDFVYVRLHGDQELYVSGYDDRSLDSWAAKVRSWVAGGRDVYVYFDNDVKVRAPVDAIALAQRLREVAPTT
jgi:uncharacterized protein YecE (DUF72 family)